MFNKHFLKTLETGIEGDKGIFLLIIYQVMDLMSMQMKKTWELKRTRRSPRMTIQRMKIKLKKKSLSKNQRPKVMSEVVLPNWNHHPSRNVVKVPRMSHGHQLIDPPSHEDGTVVHDHQTEWIQIQNGTMPGFKSLHICAT